MALNAAILGAGFIGQNFIRLAIQSGDALRVLDHKICPKEFEGKLTWIQGDLDDASAVKKVLQNVEVVYHFVSSTVPGDMIDEGGELIQNVVQTLQLLKQCVQQKVRRIIFVSSASVYGIQTVLPVKETATTDPISSHGIHKLAIEKYLQLFKYQHGLDCKILRLSNPYGPGQNVTGRQGFIAIAIGKIMANEVVMIRGDGSTIRDYIYIDDVTETLHLMGACETEETTFNVGSGQGHTLNEIISIFRELTGKHIQVEYSENRLVDISASILDVSKERAILHKTTKTDLKAGLIKTLDYCGIRALV